MKPQDIYRNGDGGAGPGVVGGVVSHDDDSESEESCPAEEELSLHDAGAPARALAALNALRKSRQHYDVLLLAGGAEVPAHRAVLAAASPYLLEALGTPPVALVPLVAQGAGGPAAPAPAYRVDDVDAEALRELVEYVYTGRLRVPSAAHARSLYRAAWRLRLDAPRHHLAATLLRKLTPADCLDVRALPDLAPHHLAELDAYIAHNFDEVCESGALGALPLIRIEMLRESSSEGGSEAPLAVADAALTWLRERRGGEADLQELCSRTHLLYVDAAGALRDCGELPAARGDAPELQEYRREAAERGRVARRPHAASAPAPLPGLELGARSARGACAVLAARCGARADALGAVRAGRGGGGRAAGGVRRLRPRAGAALGGAVLARQQRVGAAGGHAGPAGAVPGGAAGRRAVPAGRQRRPLRAGLGGGAGGRALVGAGAAAAGPLARGGGGRRGPRGAVRGGRVGRRPQPAPGAPLRSEARRLDRGAVAQHRSFSMRGRMVLRSPVGAGRVRRVALPRQHRAAPAGPRAGARPELRTRRMAAGAPAADRQTLRRGRRLARGPRRGGRVRRGGLAQEDRLVERRYVENRAGAAARARGAGAGRGARRAVRGGRLRRQGVPGVRGVPVPARGRVDHAVRARLAAAAGRPAGAPAAPPAPPAAPAAPPGQARRRRRLSAVTSHTRPPSHTHARIL